MTSQARPTSIQDASHRAAEATDATTTTPPPPQSPEVLVRSRLTMATNSLGE